MLWVMPRVFCVLWWGLSCCVVGCCCISLGDGTEPANFVGFQGSVPLLPHLCQLSVQEVGVCGVYSESP